MPCRPWREDRPLYKVPHTFPSSRYFQLTLMDWAYIQNVTIFFDLPGQKILLFKVINIAEIFCRRSDLFPYSRPDVDPTDDPYPPFRPSYTIASLWEFIFKSSLLLHWPPDRPIDILNFAKLTSIDTLSLMQNDILTWSSKFAICTVFQKKIGKALAKINWYLNSQVSVWSRAANPGWDHI